MLLYASNLYDNLSSKELERVIEDQHMTTDPESVVCLANLKPYKNDYAYRAKHPSHSHAVAPLCHVHQS